MILSFHVLTHSPLLLVSRFAARLLAWFLSRILQASVEFRVAGCNCLRDVSVKFSKVVHYTIYLNEDCC